MKHRCCRHLDKDTHLLVSSNNGIQGGQLILNLLQGVFLQHQESFGSVKATIPNAWNVDDLSCQARWACGQEMTSLTLVFISPFAKWNTVPADMWLLLSALSCIQGNHENCHAFVLSAASPPLTKREVCSASELNDDMRHMRRQYLGDQRLGTSSRWRR